MRTLTLLLLFALCSVKAQDDATMQAARRAVATRTLDYDAARLAASSGMSPAKIRWALEVRAWCEANPRGGTFQGRIYDEVGRNERLATADLVLDEVARKVGELVKKPQETPASAAADKAVNELEAAAAPQPKAPSMIQSESELRRHFEWSVMHPDGGEFVRADGSTVMVSKAKRDEMLPVYAAAIEQRGQIGPVTKGRTESTYSPIGSNHKAAPGMVWTGTGWAHPDRGPSPARMRRMQADAAAAVGILDGALVVAQDGRGTVLGSVGDRFGLDSIFNPYSNEGSRFGLDSVNNQYGDFGSRYSDLSARNEFAQQPPMIIMDGEVVGYLTTNKYLPGAINFYELKEAMTGE